ncbi:MAG: hypothetical protein WB783_00100 [Arenicellales bacterium]
MLAISRRTRNRILLLILIPVLAYGAARVLIWYTVKDAMHRVHDALAPVATVTYARILSPVFGRFGVTGVRVRPHLFNDDISIGSALINIEDPLDKLQFLRTARSRQFPDNLDLSLNDVRIPLTKEVVAWLDERMTPPEAVEGVPAACRTGTSVTASDMKKMGYDDVTGDVLVHYTYDRRSGDLAAYVKLVIEDMVDATLEGTIPASEVVFNVDQLHGMPRFSKLSISVSDPSWTSRFNEYCARAMGITAPEYVKTRIADTRQDFESANFEPSDELMKGLESFAAGKSRLTVTLDPQNPIALAQLNNPGGGADYLIDTLGIGVQFDGHAVDDLGAIKTAETTTTTPAPQQPQQEAFKPTSIEELPQYLKLRVRVLMTDGNVQRGYLDSIDAEKMVLTRHLVGGSATFDVALKDVKQVLVLRP